MTNPRPRSAAPLRGLREHAPGPVALFVSEATAADLEREIAPDAVLESFADLPGWWEKSAAR